MFQTVNKHRFVGWLKATLLPEQLRRGDVIHDRPVAPARNVCGNRINCFPPYSPDFHPIATGVAHSVALRGAPGIASPDSLSDVAR